MNITLYKNCCLNDSYTEAFALKTRATVPYAVPLLIYLNSLTKCELTIEYTYANYNGTLVFDYRTLNYAGSIYEFNYMKVMYQTSSGDSITRYCFIKDIIVKNDVVYLSYQEDIWHSYSDKIKGFNPSTLCSSRLIKEYNLDPVEFNLNFGVMKLDYDTFSGIYINQIEPINFYDDKWTLIVELQTFDLDSAGKNTDRSFYYVSIETSSGNEPTLSEFDTLIHDIIKNAVTGSYKFKATDGYKSYYELGNIYLFPSYFNLRDTSSLLGRIVKVVTGQSDTVKALVYSLDEKEITTKASIDIDLNYKVKEIGTLQTRLEVQYNKLETYSPARIKFVASNYGISVMLEFQGQLADITNDFLLNYPIDYIGAAEYKQQKINVTLQKAYAGMNIMTNLFGMNASYANDLNNAVQAIGNVGGSAQEFSQSESSASEAGLYVAIAKAAAKRNASGMNYMYEMARYGENIFKDVTQIMKLYSKAYGTN